MIKPLFDRVLIKLDSAEEKIGKIIIPEAHRERAMQQGVVVEIGNDVKRSQLKKGDKVMLAKFAGNEIEVKDSRGATAKFVIVEEEDILAICS